MVITFLHLCIYVYVHACACLVYADTCVRVFMHMCVCGSQGSNSGVIHSSGIVHLAFLPLVLFFLFFFCKCTYRCVCMYAMHVCALDYKGLTWMSCVFFNYSALYILTLHFIYWGNASCWTWSLTILVGLASQFAQKATRLCLLRAGTTGGHHTCLSFTWVLGIWTSDACKSSGNTWKYHILHLMSVTTGEY